MRQNIVAEAQALEPRAKGLKRNIRHEGDQSSQECRTTVLQVRGGNWLTKMYIDFYL
jgi:hypothetical protein